MRNVARRSEERRAAQRDAPGSRDFDADLVEDEASLTRVFDRAWARAVLRAAVRRMEAAAEGGGDEPRRHVELLRLRFRDERSLADIARDRGEAPALVYRAHERALAEFARSLRETVAFHHPHAPERVARECRELLDLIR